MLRSADVLRAGATAFLDKWTARPQRRPNGSKSRFSATIAGAGFQGPSALGRSVKLHLPTVALERRAPSTGKLVASLRSGLLFWSLLLAETDAALRRELPVGSEADFVPVGLRLLLGLDYGL